MSELNTSPDTTAGSAVRERTRSDGATLAPGLGRPRGRRTVVDGLVRALVWVAALIAIIPLFWILITVVSRGAPLLFTQQPPFTKICAVAEDAPSKDQMDFKRVPKADCENGGGEAKWTWLSGGKYPAVNDFVEYNPVTPTTTDPNAPRTGIRVRGQAVEQPNHVIGLPGSDDAGTVRKFSLDWWTKDQQNIDQKAVGGGALHAIVGTLMLGLLTSLVAVPLGVLGAIYLVEYARGKRFARVVSFMVDILTGVPSIVAALFIYAVFITTFGGHRSTLASAMALVILMLPTVLRSTEEMLKLVPDSLREASYALGIPKWKTIMSVVVPTSMKGILTGIVLGIARVMGETAPLIILLQYFQELEWNPLNTNMGSLPTMVMNAADVAGTYPAAERGWGAALTLILIVMGLNLVARAVGTPKKSR